MTVYDALLRASAQQFGGEAQTDDLEDEEILKLYMQYAQEGFLRIWHKIDPIDEEALPEIKHLDCPAITRDTSLDPYEMRVFDVLSDFITWRMFGTGNAAKQQRGEWFYQRFIEGLGRLRKHASWDKYYEITGLDDSKFRNVWNW